MVRVTIDNIKSRSDQFPWDFRISHDFRESGNHNEPIDSLDAVRVKLAGSHTRNLPHELEFVQALREGLPVDHVIQCNVLLESAKHIAPLQNVAVIYLRSRRKCAEK